MNEGPLYYGHTGNDELNSYQFTATIYPSELYTVAMNFTFINT